MFNNEYQPTHNINSQIYSYTAQCSIDPEETVIAQTNEAETLIKLQYSSKLKMMISIFVNVTEYENPQINVTENIFTAEQDSYEKHYLCKPGKNKEIKCKVPLGILKIKEINTNFDKTKSLDRRYKLMIRLEPEQYKHRFVNMYYFDIESHDDAHALKLIKQKIEIRKKSYFVYDIFGLETLKTGRMNEDAINKYCKICLDNQIAVIILPCRHMCLCLECAMLYNQKDSRNKNKMKHECPICRGGIKSFINIQGLEDGE